MSQDWLGYASGGLSIASKVARFSNIPGAEQIVEIVRSIVDAAGTAERNKATCRNLANMVECANEQLNDQIPESENEMSQTLKYYIECLENIKKFLLKQQKPHRAGVITRILYADEVANQVVELSGNLQFAVGQLTLHHVQIIREQKSIPHDSQVEAEVIAIKDNAPIGKELLKQIRISSEDIYDDRSKLAVRRGTKAHVLKRIYSVQRYPVAEKSIGKVDYGGVKDKNFWKEVAILRLLEKCSSILKFYGIVERNGERFSITDWAKNGDMKTYFETHTLNWTDKLKIALQIAQGLAFCHQADVLHHDVRSHNIFLDGDRNAKLTNFDWSRKEDDPNSIMKPISDILSVMRWTAPEKMNPDQRFTKECDVYSFAIVLWEIATQQLPYGNVENLDVSKKVINGERPIIDISGIPEEYRMIMVEGWDAEPRNRPKMSDFCLKLSDMNNSCEGGDISFSYNQYSRPTTPLLQVPAVQWMNPYIYPRDDDFEHYSSENEDDENAMSDFTPPNLDDAISLYNNKKYPEAWSIFEILSNTGVLKAQYYAGLYYVNGLEPVAMDIQQGLYLWKNAADRGDRDAQYKYGFAFDKGGLAGIDKEISRKYIKMAYHQDHPALLYNYGSRYSKDKDYVKAVDHFRRAHAQGHPRAWDKLNELKELGYS
ncbi:hypothetical protein G9A89_019168 [Geosiphon pyriformis]|nr:hypothetical protein G9A89_019168 [Geosiphon pyriformis]